MPAAPRPGKKPKKIADKILRKKGDMAKGNVKGDNVADNGQDFKMGIGKAKGLVNAETVRKLGNRK